MTRENFINEIRELFSAVEIIIYKENLCYIYKIMWIFITS